MSRIAILIMLLAALPLRGYAGALMAMCESHHGGTTVAVQEHVHDHAQGYDHATHDHEPAGDSSGLSQSASACSLCTSCCVNATLASDVVLTISFQAPGPDRIPFFDRVASGFVPEHLDRPPLSR